MTEAQKVPSTAAKPQRNPNHRSKNKRSKGKPKKKPLPPIKRGEPIFTYTSECCSARAEKPACERTREDISTGTFSQSPLGKWKCSSCGRKCKVTRSKNKPVGPVTELTEAA